MEMFSPHTTILCLFLFLSLFPQSSLSQQSYLNNSWNSCSTNRTRVLKGYLCDGYTKSCKSFVTFKSLKPYQTAVKIADLLGSEASEIASINNMSSTVEHIPTNNQHFTPYTIGKEDTYYITAVQIYQNLMTCQALIGQNYYEPEEMPVGVVMMVPVRCACRSENQTTRGVKYLLSYIIEINDTFNSISKKFGVSVESILEANILSLKSIILASTPLLVPLRIESCNTNPRMIFCECPSGHLAYGSLEHLNCNLHRGRNKFPVKLVTLLGVGNGFALLCMFLSSYKLYQYLQRRRIRIRKEGFFKQNGGILLQEKLSSYSSNEQAKLFTAEELQRATNNFNQSHFLGKGGYGTVYNGMLTDSSIVAVKRSKAIGRNQIEQFINEVVILSQINHRNIVKLLGCCLETETPLLVYEFISNGTLYDHICKKDPELSLLWEKRFNIACDVAAALAYMHSAASMPFFHRDIKSSNILLDDKFNAKVSDFGTSRSVPHDKTHLTTAVQGTLGYMDPEYFQQFDIRK